MDLLIVVGLMFAGATVGVLIALSRREFTFEAVFAAACAGAVAGTLAGYVVLALIQRRKVRARRRRPLHRPERCEPTEVPYVTRLNRFLKSRRQEQEGSGHPFRSKMPFWSAIETWLRTPPKSAARIRRLLISIRRTLLR